MNKDGQLFSKEWENKSEDLKELIGGYAILEIEKINRLLTSIYPQTKNYEND